MNNCISNNNFIKAFQKYNNRAHVDSRIIDLYISKIRSDIKKNNKPSLDLNDISIKKLIGAKKYSKQIQTWLSEFVERNKNKIDDRILKLCIINALELIDNNLVPIFHTKDLAAKIGVTKKYLYWLANTSEKQYSVYEIKKSSGGARIIAAPNVGLKRVQRWIYNNILKNVELHELCEGFRKSRSIVTNCLHHTNKEIIIKFDISECFPAIKFKRVLGMFLSIGYVFNVAYLLAKLTTYNDELAQGSPASPAISNIILKRLDSRLSKLAETYKANYSRYADDLTFSSNDNDVLKIVNFIQKIITEEGFKVSLKKFGIYRKGLRQKVTGLIANNKVNIPREKIKLIRAILFNCSKHGVGGQFKKWKEKFGHDSEVNFDNFINFLCGNIAFIAMVSPDSAERLKNVFNPFEIKKNQDR